MKTLANLQSYTGLREGRVWSLLAAIEAPRNLALFQALFKGSETITQAALATRLTEELVSLSQAGFAVTQDASYFINSWRSKGWLYRTLPQGSDEEVYGLTAEARAAIRFVQHLEKPRVVATESRLSSLMHQVERLAADTNNDPQVRLEMLQAEALRIQEEIQKVSAGNFEVLPEDRARERVEEILELSSDMLADFQNVTSSFEGLDQYVRMQMLQAENSRGEALTALFDGVDYIKNSEAGRTFDALWRLLMDHRQAAGLDDALDSLISRDFAQHLSAEDRHFLMSLPSRMVQEAGAVQSVMHRLGTSLNRFVRNDDPTKSRRITEVIGRAEQAAMVLKEHVDSRADIPFTITQTVPQVRSMSQWTIRAPEEAKAAPSIVIAEPAVLEGAAIAAMVASAEIKLTPLMDNIKACLATQESITLSELLERFPVKQGLGSVCGYLVLATKSGALIDEGTISNISWLGSDSLPRSAAMPSVTFTQSTLKGLK